MPDPVPTAPQPRPTAAPASTIHDVLWPVRNLDAAVRFYVEGLGMPLKFRDGDRFAAIAAGGVTLALVAGTEDVTGGVPSAGFLVADLMAAVRSAEAAGGTVAVAAHDGPHERRAVIRDPGGQLVVFYERR